MHAFAVNFHMRLQSCPRPVITQPSWTHTSSIHLQPSSSTSPLPTLKPCLNHWPKYTWDVERFLSHQSSGQGVLCLLSFSSFVLFQAESFDTGLFSPAYPHTGQARVGKIELKNKCTQIFPAVPVSLLSLTTTDLGMAPCLCSFLQWSLLPKYQRCPPTTDPLP